MDDEEDLEEFHQKERDEQQHANWQDIKDEDVQAQLSPEENPFSDETHLEEEWEGMMRDSEREFRLQARSGSLTEWISTSLIQKIMGAQLKRGARGARGRLSGLIGNLVGRIFGVFSRGERTEKEELTKVNSLAIT
jgi:hypothetical protein